MTDASSNVTVSSSPERPVKLESLIELAVCLLIGLASLAVVAWLALTGRLAYLDGISLALISLALGGFFLYDVFAAYRGGEVDEMLGRRKEASPASKAGKTAATPPPPEPEG